MSIFYKSTIERTIQELDVHYAKLKSVLEGKPVSAAEIHVYAIHDKNEKITRVNVEDVLDAVAHFKTAVDNLRRIKSRAMKP